LPAEAAAVLIVLAAIIPVLPLPARDEAIRRKAAFEAADDSWKEIQMRWLNESGPSLFESERNQLRRKRDEYHDLDRTYARERGLLEAAKREKQLEQFLDRYFIDHAKIPKIGPGRKATLASYGVETAADVTYARRNGVPGFGPTLVASLMVWRAGIERKFTFNPMQQLDPRELARLDQRFEPPRKQLQSLLRAGPARLVAIRHQVEVRRTQLRGELESRAVAWAQARADLDALQ
jgi:DNA-binding helix-hairpin-helix protein with protein kinase domain